MSYARMSGEFSDLYLIHNINGYYECISCRIQKQVSYPAWEYDGKDVVQIPGRYFKDYPSYTMLTIKAVYRHVRHHLYAHHKVPIETIQRIVAEYYKVPVVKLQELWPHESWEFPTCEFCSGIKWGEGIEGSLTPYCDGECGLF